MRSHFKRSAWLVVMVGALCLRSGPALAHGGDGFGWVFKMLFGNQESQDNVQKCGPEKGPPSQGSGQGGKGGGPSEGMLGIVNGFFCHMEAMGIANTGQVTKSMTQMRPKIVSGVMQFQNGAPVMEQTTFTVTASVRAKTDATAAEFTDDGTVYTYLGEVWVKRGDAAFSRALRILWTGTGVVSAGRALADPGAFSDGAGGAMNLKWSRDASGVGSVTAKVFHNMPSFDGGSMTMKMYALGTRAAGILTARMVSSMNFSQGSFSGTHSFRLSTRIDTVANTGGVSFEMSDASGFCSGDGCKASADPNALNDAPTQVFCFSRTADSTSGDFTFTPAAPGCSVPNFADQSINNVIAYTANSVLTLGATLWGGMAATPP